MSKQELHKLLNKVFQAPSFGEGYVIPIYVPYSKTTTITIIASKTRFAIFALKSVSKWKEVGNHACSWSIKSRDNSSIKGIKPSIFLPSSQNSVEYATKWTMKNQFESPFWVSL